MTLNTIYLICAIAGGTILVLRIILTVIGLDHGADAVDTADVGHVDVGHADTAHDHGGGGIGMNLLSLQSLAGFFTMFGLVGMGLLQAQLAPIWSLLGALVAGGITAWATAFIFFQMGRLQSEGNMVITDAIGQVGTVYLTIPESGTGVVSVTVKGTLRSLDAISETGKRIPTGAIVRVVSITAGKILVVAEQTADHS